MGGMMRRVLTQVPDVPTGAIWNPRRGYFSVVIPIERTNEITNPSAEFATTNYTTGAGTLTRSTEQQYHGAYSLKYVPSAATTDGFYYGTVSMTAGQTRAISCKWYGAAGVKYKLSVATTGGVDLVSYTFVATGRWQWIYLYWTETSTTTRRIYFTKNGSTSVAAFYIDGVQSEVIVAGETVSTYIDGDQTGLLTNQFPPPYRWNGTAHASTSTRLISTAAGGYVRNLDFYRLKALAFAGLGLMAVSNIATVGAGADGAQYQTTVAQSRQFSINGFWDAETPGALDQARAGLYDAVGPDHAFPRQPVTLFYQPFDGDDEIGAFGRIVASYQSGLEQNATPTPRENVPITFTQFLPGIVMGDDGATLTELSALGTIGYILQRSPLGVWSGMGTGGVGGTVFTIAIGPNGRVYAGGSFTSMGGVANTDGIAYWDPTTATWNAMGTGISGGANLVSAIAIAPNGDVIVGGDFTQMGGVANTVRIARWDGSAWNALSTGASDDVVSIAVAQNGNIYAGGLFTTIGGVAINRIAVWNGSAWATVGAGGADNIVSELKFGPGDILYAGGNFTTIGGVSANYAAYWNGTTWTAMGSLSDQVQALAIGPRGEVYAGGNFSGFAAVWNGTGWTTLGTLNGIVSSMHYGNDGILRAGGVFTTGDGVTFNDNFAYWNGSTWIQPDVAVAGAATFYAIAQAPDGTLYLGFDRSDAVGTAAVTTITNTSTARTYPTLILQGPSSNTSSMYQLINFTNGKALYFNYQINPNELVYVRMSPHSATFWSSANGFVSSAILRGSSPDFALEKGTNSISLFLSRPLVASPILQWPITLQSASDLVSR